MKTEIQTTGTTCHQCGAALNAAYAADQKAEGVPPTCPPCVEAVDYGTPDLPPKVAPLTVRFRGKTYSVDSVEAASDLWCDFRDASGLGASKIGSNLPVMRGREVVARISYNGRIWPA